MRSRFSIAKRSSDGDSVLAPAGTWLSVGVSRRFRMSTLYSNSRWRGKGALGRSARRESRVSLKQALFLRVREKENGYS